MEKRTTPLNQPGECISGHYLYSRIIKKLSLEETKVFMETIVAFLFEILPAPVYSLLLACLKEVIASGCKKSGKEKLDWSKEVCTQGDSLLKGLVSIIQRAPVLEIKVEALHIIHLYLVQVMVDFFQKGSEGSSVMLEGGSKAGGVGPLPSPS